MPTTPAGQLAIQNAIDTFRKSSPSTTPADLIQLVNDVAAGSIGVLNAEILANAPNIPVIGHFIDNEMVQIADDTVKNLAANVSLYIQTGGT